MYDDEDDVCGLFNFIHFFRKKKIRNNPNETHTHIHTHILKKLRNQIEKSIVKNPNFFFFRSILKKKSPSTFPLTTTTSSFL